MDKRTAHSALQKTRELLARARAHFGKGGKESADRLRRALVLQRAAWIALPLHTNRQHPAHARAWLSIRLTLLARHELGIYFTKSKLRIVHAELATRPEENLDGAEQPKNAEAAIEQTVAEADKVVPPTPSHKVDESTPEGVESALAKEKDD